jgi:hypothetical protein
MMFPLFSSLSFLFLIASTDGFSFQQKRLSRLPTLSMKQIVIFGPNNLRVHDNPCLLHNKENSIIPVIFSPYKDIKLQQAASDLQIKLQAMGGNALHFDGNDSHSDLFLFVKQLNEDCDEKEEISVIYSQSAVEPAGGYLYVHVCRYMYIHIYLWIWTFVYVTYVYIHINEYAYKCEFLCIFIYVCV